MASIHKGLTVTVSIAEQDLRTVSDLLEHFHKDIHSERDLYREKLPSTFFISWLTLPPELYADKEMLPARILLLSSYTGNKNDHIKELVAFMADKLTRVFSFSKEFPSGNIDEEGLYHFLKKKSIPNTYYSGFKFIDTREVKKEQELKEGVFNFLASHPDDDALKNSSPAVVKSKIEEFVSSNPQFSWAGSGIKGLRRNKIRMLLPLMLLSLIFTGSFLFLILSFFYEGLFLKIGAIPFLILVIGVLFLFVLLRINELNPHIAAAPISDEEIHKIVSREKNHVVNEMTVITPLKKGFIRRVFLAFTLRIISYAGYFAYIPTVHTARWLQIDQGKRLVFIANFDNTSEAYAHDFVDSEARSRNMSIIFSHTFGFPPTRWLVHKGYNHRREYMKGVRAFQKITQFWYSNNTELSVENLKTNRKFREGLFKKMDDKATKNWLLTI